MIFGSVHHLENLEGWLPASLRMALDHLKKTDFTKVSAGRYDLQGSDVYVQVMDLSTKNDADTRPEIHRKYIDVQFMVKGCERIGVAVDTGRNEVAEDLLAERDLLFYRAAENESSVVLRPGNFAVFFPSDVHRPLCEVDGPQAIRKVVVKVSLASLKR